MFEERLDHFHQAWESDWEPISNVECIASLACASAMMLLAFLDSSGWTPFLDGINLLFHEAGHPIFGLLGWEALAVFGGTLMQALVPLLVMGSFWFKRQASGVAMGAWWFFQNFLNIGRYMADARAQELPLVGGGEHDWTDLLSRWGMLNQDVALGHGVRILGWFGMLASLSWLMWRWHQQKQTI
jgi:hypothetical protein